MFVCADDGQKLDLNLGISITLDGPKGTYDRGVGESQTFPHPPLHFPNGKWPVVRNTSYIHTDLLVDFEQNVIHGIVLLPSTECKLC